METPARLLTICYKIINILFSIDFGFLEYKYYHNQLIFKTISLTQCLVLTCYQVYFDYIIHGSLNFIWYSVYAIQYMTYVIFLTFHNNSITFRNFLRDFKSIDASLGVAEAEYNLEIKMLLSIFISFVFEIFTTAEIWFNIDHEINIYFRGSAIVGICTCIDVVCISNIFFYYAVLCRLKKLRYILEWVNSDFHSIQLIYKSIVQVVEKYKPAFDFLYITTLAFSVFQVMGLVYHTVCMLLSPNKSILTWVTFLNLTITINILVLAFGSALCAGMLTTEADRIKIILLDKQISHQDEPEANDIERFISYVEVRGCRFRVYKVVPLDADLLGMVLGFCATYLIVIIQFTRVN